MSRAQFSRRRRKPSYTRRRVSRLRQIARNKYLPAPFVGPSVEYKYLDCNFDTISISNSGGPSGINVLPTDGCVDAISVPAQGDSPTERDGRQFVIHSAHFSGAITWLPNQDNHDPVYYSPIYFAMVLDTQTNGIKPDTETIYFNPSSSALNLLPKPLRNLLFIKRYKILDCKVVYPRGVYQQNDTQVPANSGTSSYPMTSSNTVQVLPTVSLNWKGRIPCIANGITADVASASDNSISIVAFTGTSTGTPRIHGKSRIRFTG